MSGIYVELQAVMSHRAAARLTGVSRATAHRATVIGPKRPRRPGRPPANRLDDAERAAVLAVLNSDRFVDTTPIEVFATLLDEGVYLASIATFYRVLRENRQVKERRRQARHPARARPELTATAPGQVFTWDITKLAGPTRGLYYDAYVMIDIYSRYIVGWMVAPREGAELARKLIEETFQKQNIQPDQLSLHADRGSAMRSKPVALLLADLSVTKTHSRPYTSNDNPFSESQFMSVDHETVRRIKYRPEFPDRFGCIQDSRAFCQTFFPWYNDEHRHSGIGMMTPAMVHHGLAIAIRQNRQRALDLAYAAHPDRFVRRPPTPPNLPKEVWINKPKPPDDNTH